MKPLDTFQELQEAASAISSSAPVERIRIVSEGSPQFLAKAIAWESMRRGFHFGPDAIHCEDVAGGLLGLLEAGERSEMKTVLVVPSVERLFERFLASPEEEREDFGQQVAGQWRRARAQLAARGMSFLWCNLAPYSDGLRGYLVGSGKASFSRQIGLIHQQLIEDAGAEVNLQVFDLASLCAEVGRGRTFDPRFWYQGRLAFALDFLPTLAFHLVASLLESRGAAPKVLVCDLDDTLWGGVLAEEGIEGIALGQEDSGSVYFQLHQWLKALRARGVLLALCSKNEESLVREAFRMHPACPLKWDDFAATRINWEPKSENIRSIAQELNLGLDAVVFIDDREFEREEVRRRCPEVIVPDLPEAPELRLGYLQRLGLFPQAVESETDRLRSAHFLREKTRQELQAEFEDYTDYLKSLEMKATVETLSPRNLERVLQLSHRSNQFNLLTHRYRREELHRKMEEADRSWLIVHLKDRIGDYGLIGVIEAGVDGEEARIENWFMSCRVLQRQVEVFMLNQLAGQLRSRGIIRLMGVYSPTSKNQLVRQLLPDLGFSPTGADGNWMLDLKEFRPQVTLISRLSHE